MSKNQLIVYCEKQKIPFVIDNVHPFFSWKLQNPEKTYRQAEASIYLSMREKMDDIIWTCRIEKDTMHCIYDGPELQSRSVYFYQVILVDEKGRQFSSQIGSFETGLLHTKDWKAEWILPQKDKTILDKPELDEEGEPAPIAPEKVSLGEVYRLRRIFKVKNKVEKARLYMTAHGVYVPLLDGKRIGDGRLAPGHSNYRQMLYYQTYDVTNDLTPGIHTIGCMLSDGWFKGRMGFGGDNCQYGDETALLCQMEITYEDGSKELVCSDQQFIVGKSGFWQADIMCGERLDASALEESFFTNICNTNDGTIPRILSKDNCIGTYSYQKLKADTDKVIEVEKVHPVAIYPQADGSYMLDFGKNIAGTLSFCIKEKTDREIIIEFSELEGKDHSFEKNIVQPYREYQIRYLPDLAKEQKYESHFSYYGFRYCKVSGLVTKPSLEEFTAIVLSSQLEKIGHFYCSDKEINQLQENIFRSQISNFISIPTDCPQREKAGWTGDVRVYAATAAYLQDISLFMKRWLKEVKASQKENGCVPIIVPYLDGYYRSFEGIDTSAGWGDVIISLPWDLYQAYGEKAILEDCYSSMKKWMEYVADTAASENPEELIIKSEEERYAYRNIWNTGFHFGDWLTPSVSLNSETGVVDLMQSAVLTMDIVPTMLWADDCKIMAEVAKVLEKYEDARYYREKYESIRSSFQRIYLQKDTIDSELQGVHVLALHAGLVSGEKEIQTRKKLISLIRANKGGLDTGFMSTPFLLDVLCDAGESQLAYEILMNHDCPSWLYEISQGATSIWESWQAILPDGTNSHLSMSHYAYGCVGDFMYRHILGIQKEEAGYRKILLMPDISEYFSYAGGSLDTPYGKLEFYWEKQGEKILCKGQIPFGTEANLVIYDNKIKLRPGYFSTII